ncbi:MAG: hypothetical protein IJ480_02655 [Clostridia bacterium]|nr:hypothetical protein [Clostridia bacterium]
MTVNDGGIYHDKHTDPPGRFTIPFRHLPAMAPMASHENGGLLSQLSFRYGDSFGQIFAKGRLAKPMRYAAICTADGTVPAGSNIDRARRRVPKRKTLLEERR